MRWLTSDPHAMQRIRQKWLTDLGGLDGQVVDACNNLPLAGHGGAVLGLRLPDFQTLSFERTTYPKRSTTTKF